MRKWILIGLVIAGIVAYNYIYQAHRDIKNEPASFTVFAKDIDKEFAFNSIKAEQKYFNKTIEISGIISTQNDKTLTLNNAVFCQFEQPIKSINTAKKLTIKGRFIGYDDLLKQVKLDQCYIIN